MRYNGSDCHIYIQDDGQDIMLVNLPYKELKPLSKITLPVSTGEKIVTKTNWSFFVMSGTEKGQRLGRCVGYPDICECQDPDGLLDVVITKDDKVIDGDFYGGDYRDVKVGFMTSCIIVRDHKPVKELSSGYSSFYNKKNPQTIYGQLSNGKHVLVVVEGRTSDDSGLTYSQCASLMIELGSHFACMGDGGGSSEMIVNDKIVSQLSEGSERYMTNALCFVTDISEKEETKEVNELKGIYMNVNSVGVYIRESLSFNSKKKANGKILKFISSGQKIQVIGFVNGIQKDGYQWMKVKSGDIVGYSQYDSMCYWLESE